MNIYILKKHQKNAKYCLLKQEVIDENKISKDLYKCEFCLSKIPSKQKQKHDDNCKLSLKKTIEKMKSIITQKDIEIQKLQTSNDIYKDIFKHSRDTVDDIAKKEKSKNINNITETNNIINMSPLDINKDKFGKTIDELFDKNYLLNGQKGVARFAVDNLLRDDSGNLTYRCTDPSRQIYRYRSLDGEMVKDVKAKKLTSSLLDKLTTKSSDITNEEIRDGNEDKVFLYGNNFMEIKRLEDDNKDFILELASLTG